MRYTECRGSTKPALALLEDIDEGTVDFQPNYDGKESEPTVLPARFPNLLVNGAGGIAVGMATNIPPHNLGEVIDAAIAMIDRPDMSVAELMEIVPGPDFPTAATILGRGGIRNAYRDRARLDHHARQVRDRNVAQGSRGDHHHRNSLSGEQGGADRAHRRTRHAKRRSRASPICATSPIATACASSLS